jgi:hypothetical protein
VAAQSAARSGDPGTSGDRKRKASEPYANRDNDASSPRQSGMLGGGGRGGREVQTGRIPDRIDRADI